MDAVPLNCNCTALQVTRVFSVFSRDSAAFSYWTNQTNHRRLLLFKATAHLKKLTYMIFLWPVALALSFLNITEPHSTTKSQFIKLLTSTFLSLWMYFFFYCTVIQFFSLQGLQIHNKQKKQSSTFSSRFSEYCILPLALSATNNC